MQNIPSHFWEMDLSARVDINFVRVDENLQNGHCDQQYDQIVHSCLNEWISYIN